MLVAVCVSVWVCEDECVSVCGCLWVCVCVCVCVCMCVRMCVWVWMCVCMCCMCRILSLLSCTFNAQSCWLRAHYKILFGALQINRNGDPKLGVTFLPHIGFVFCHALSVTGIRSRCFDPKRPQLWGHVCLAIFNPLAVKFVDWALIISWRSVGRSSVCSQENLFIHSVSVCCLKISCHGSSPFILSALLLSTELNLSLTSRWPVLFSCGFRNSKFNGVGNALFVFCIDLCLP